MSTEAYSQKNLKNKNDSEDIIKSYNFGAISIAESGKHATMIISETCKFGKGFQIFCGQGLDRSDLTKFSGINAGGIVYCSSCNPSRKK